MLEENIAGFLFIIKKVVIKNKMSTLPIPVEPIF
jgi:hypothetical protein